MSRRVEIRLRPEDFRDNPEMLEAVKAALAMRREGDEVSVTVVPSADPVGELKPDPGLQAESEAAVDAALDEGRELPPDWNPLSDPLDLIREWIPELTLFGVVVVPRVVDFLANIAQLM